MIVNDAGTICLDEWFHIVNTVFTFMDLIKGKV